MHGLNDACQQACHMCVLDWKMNLGWLWRKCCGLWLS